MEKFIVNGKFKELTGAELETFKKDATPEELGTYLKAKNENEIALLKANFQSQIDALKEESQKDEVEKLKKQMQTAISELEAFGLRIKQINDVKVGKDRSLTPLKEILEQNKAKITSLKNDGNKFEIEVDENVFKASHTSTDISDRNELGQFIAGVSAIPHKKVYMESLFTRGNASTEYIKYVQQATIVRDAKNVAACATSTHNSKVTFSIADLQMKKLRDFTSLCIDMVEDYSFIESEIRSLVNTGVALKKDYDLLLGDGTGAIINGIDSYASTFSASASGANYAGKVANATAVDLLVVAGAQIKAFGAENFFSPNVIVMNPIDATLLGLLKDADENYIKMGALNANVFRTSNGSLYINGMLVVENPNCPANEAYVMDSTKATFYSRKGTVIEFAYENGTNFEQELVTVKAYERCNLLIKNNDANAFTHIADIAAGVTAITAGS